MPVRPKNRRRRLPYGGRGGNYLSDARPTVAQFAYACTNERCGHVEWHTNTESVRYHTCRYQGNATVRLVRAADQDGKGPGDRTIVVGPPIE